MNSTFIAVLLIGFVPTQALFAEGLRLRELMQSSQGQSAQQKSSQLLMEAALKRQRAEEKSFWPSLNVETTHGRSESGSADNGFSRDSSRGWISQFSFGTSWQLWDNGEYANRLKIAETDVLSTETDQRLAGLENRYRLARAFFDWQSLIVEAEIDRQVRELLTTQFRQIERQFRQGLKTSRDYQRMRAELKRLDLQDTSKSYRKAELVQQIATLSGLDAEQLHQRGVAGLKRLPDAGENLIAQLAQSSGAALQDESERLKLERLRLQVKRDDYLNTYPEVRLSVSAQFGTASYVPEFVPNFSENFRPQWSAILSVNYELWDWGVKRARAQAGWDSVRAEEIKITEAQSVRQANRQVRQIKLSELAKQYDLSVELLKLEQANFDVVQSEFRQGKLTYLDMITALRELSTARRQRYEFYFQIVEQLAEIHFAEGNLDEWAKNF